MTELQSPVTYKVQITSRTGTVLCAWADQL